MSIIGTSYPKFYITSGSDILLEHSLLKTDYIIPDTLEHVSVLNGDIHYIARGDRTEMEVTVYLYKYDDPGTKYAEIKTAKGQEVIFYPHADGTFIQNRVGGAVPLYCENIKPFYLFQTVYYDAVKMTFISKGITRMVTLAQSEWGYGFNYGDFYGAGL